jgi:sugar/nucleoside kinase (ribokinase family)
MAEHLLALGQMVLILLLVVALQQAVAAKVTQVDLEEAVATSTALLETRQVRQAVQELLGKDLLAVVVTRGRMGAVVAVLAGQVLLEPLVMVRHTLA